VVGGPEDNDHIFHDNERYRRATRQAATPQQGWGMIKPWVFEFFPAPREPGATTDPQRSADYFNLYLDLWPRAEPLGYEGIFFSEHHFGPAYSPAPNLLIAQVALKTRTIRLGVMGLVPAAPVPRCVAIRP
jgi:Luciferase-like monooxygenase